MASSANEMVDIEVTIDSRHEVIPIRVNELTMKNLKANISSTFAIPDDTIFIFKYKGMAPNYQFPYLFT
jgi:hypothetical protein